VARLRCGPSGEVGDDHGQGRRGDERRPGALSRPRPGATLCPAGRREQRRGGEQRQSEDQDPAAAAGHYERVGPCRPPGPVSQHEGIAIKDQIHQGGTVRRGNRAQIGGKTGYVGEQVHRPEPAREFSRRNDALDVPGRLLDQYPASGPGGAARHPVPLGREGTVTVRPQSAHFDLGERAAPALWVTGHAPIFGPPPDGGQTKRDAESSAINGASAGRMHSGGFPG
jgi:hypothetical protein